MIVRLDCTREGVSEAGPSDAPFLGITVVGGPCQETGSRDAVDAGACRPECALMEVSWRLNCAR